MADRRHVSIHLAGRVAESLDLFRRQWDPVMASLTPPHVTLVYPEETVDEAALLARLRDVCCRSPIPLDFEDFLAEGRGEGGVFLRVADPSGQLEALRDELLLPPQRWLGFPFHTTIVHPRTSN